MYHFCTYFDSHFLSKGLALYQSLENHCRTPFKLFVLCMDNQSYSFLAQQNLQNIRLIRLKTFEHNDHKLLEAKINRTRIEYYFTCTPSFPLFILNSYPDIDHIIYLDADIMFFSDPSPLYEEIKGHSIAIIAHRFPPNLRSKEKCGIYNVGFLYFKRDEPALKCLQWWRDKCIEWCYDKVEDNRYADQKYLDDWPIRFDGVTVLENKGANLAPWNIGNYNIVATGNNLWVDGQQLVFFHFHGFRKITNWLYDPNTSLYKVKLSKIMENNIYSPYINMLSEVSQFTLPHHSQVYIPDNIRDKSAYLHKMKWLYWKLDQLIRILKMFVTKNFIVKINGITF